MGGKITACSVAKAGKSKKIRIFLGKNYLQEKIRWNINTSDIDRRTLKSVAFEILFENPKYFKDIIREILVENQITINEEQADRRKKQEKMINEDFDQQDEVFESLA